MHGKGKTKMQQLFNRNLFLDLDELLDMPAKADKLFEHQKVKWKLANEGYKSLSKVEIKKFEFDGFYVEAHFNPGRITSSSAKVDSKSIEARPCFLCVKNLPEDQKTVKIYGDYILLVNPFPIFDKHFTIPSVNHVPQSIENEFNSLINISLSLGKDYSVFYNGPKCGASAPDHLHFQAGNFGFMSIDTQFDYLTNKYGKILLEENDFAVKAVDDTIRKYFIMESQNAELLQQRFCKLFEILDKDDVGEPLLNIICHYDKSWRAIIFPRSKHRPTYYYLEGDDKILISPAAVDFGGVLIFPREEDFKKINKDLIIDIFNQVTISEERLYHFSKKIKNSIK